MVTTSTNAAFAQGAIQAGNDIQHNPADGNAVILDFGAPSRNTSGVNGVNIVFTQSPNFVFEPISSIEAIVEAYAQGYLGYGGNSPSLTIIVGVNNGTNLDDTQPDIGPLTAHAQAWSAMLDRINGYFAQQGWTPQIRADAGADIETEFSTNDVATQWVRACV